MTDQPPACGHRTTVGTSSFICVRPYHGGHRTGQDAYRRRHGRTPSADKHVYVRSIR